MAGKAPLVVVGDALLDRDLTGHADRLAPDAPVPVVADCAERVRPGGAALTAYLAARDGRDVTLITGLGDDPAGRELRRLLQPWLTLVPLPTTGALPEKTRVLAQGRPVVRLDRGTGRVRGATDEARAALGGAPAVLVSDYGRGAADALRDELCGRPPAVWDPHPRGGPPVPGTRLVTPARSEAHQFAGALVRPDGTDRTREAHGAVPGGASDGGRGNELWDVAHEATALVRHWRVAAVTVTLGARGALLSYGEHPLLVPAPAAHHGDPCGAGDRFAAAAAGLLADGALVGEAVEGAVAEATAFVGAGGAGGLPDPPRTGASASGSGRAPTPADGASSADGCRARADGSRAAARDVPGVTADGSRAATADGPRTADDPFEVVARVRTGGGTVVAAGGCFDLLHAGHVGLLQAARRIGDCLVVCVNSDASVRRRKGDGRPVNPLADRVRVLRALACVDAVAVFDEDTPERLLAELRPDVWVKGGDYAGAELPEAALLEEWGGQAVLLPYLDGRSSTALMARAAESAR
ncbi:D-glycero-beta-D-manno-heptose 1-phosphate adenylyltransferase [Streptomyces sp. NPDC046197]|uniref:D-glycero-beta-D-manno-heptose 1-phosphate adenylyltransferase n=1 Tax=Streptomyces sp. NPDC046197 TaxID=3154337 RepID=UPI0033FB7E33